MVICDETACTGCGICSYICPIHCITMIENSMGHLFPKINKNKCVNCHKCKDTCPLNRCFPPQKALKTYACWASNAEIRKDSTSGGVATVMADKILGDGGIVYGAAFVDGNIRHIRVNCKNDISLLQGSKYVESPIVNILDNLMSDLRDGKQVLFIGTPCQCAAIHAIKGETDNIVLVELICSGVPPQKLLWENLKNKEFDAIRFRNQSTTQLSLRYNGCIVYQKPVWKDYFLMGFSKHLFFRESCYRCKYASLERIADITIGDFWGLGKNERFSEDTKDGVSVLIVNNETGMLFYNMIKEAVFYEERSIEEAVQGNPRYYMPSEKHPKREIFIESYEKHGFRFAVKKALCKDIIKNNIYEIARVIKKSIIK